MSNYTRFRHTLFGGVGLFDPPNKAVNLQHDFDPLYGIISPYSEISATAPSTDAYAKPMPGITSLNVR